MAEILLTTGQMLDQLKIGEVAEPLYHTGWKVTKSVTGTIHRIGTGESLKLEYPIVNAKWRILPKYVSFEEAMKAMRKGKTVKFYEDGNEIPYTMTGSDYFRPCISLMGLGKFTFKQLFEGKWTIGGDK